jgi:hypothetical protein
MDVISSSTARTQVCEVCGKQFRRPHGAKPAKTCSTKCRRESQARHMSTLRNRSGQTNCLDADGRLPNDPSPEYIEEQCRAFRFAHYAAKAAE